MRTGMAQKALAFATCILIAGGVVLGCQQTTPSAPTSKPAAQAPAAKPAEAAQPAAAPKPAAEAAKPTAAAPVQKEAAAQAPSITIDKSKWPKHVALSGGAMGTADYALATGMSKVLVEKLGLNAAVGSTTGSSNHHRAVHAGDVELGTLGASIAYEGYTGTGWAKGKKYDNVRLIMAGIPSAAQFWAPAKGGFKTVRDLDGKSVNMGAAGSTADTVGKRIVDILGIKPSKITHVSHSDANNLMADGLLDAAMAMGGYPQPAASEMATTRATVVFGIEKPDVEKIVKEYLYFSFTQIPANTYKGQTQPVPSLGDIRYIIVNKDLPADFVYSITKAFSENLKTLEASLEAAKELGPEYLEQARIPLHPGAYAYYKERGVNVPAEITPR